MTKLPTITAVSSITDAGVFKDFASSAELPPFCAHNSLYGFNGSGKTTLARVFASLGAGTKDPNLPATARFKVAMSDKSAIDSSGDLSALKGRVLVYSEDFIAENFRWKENSASPVFYLGAEQTELSKRLEEVEREVAKTKAAESAAQKAQTAANTALTTFKTAHARLIENELRIPRQYNAQQLTKDYTAKTYDASSTLSDPDVVRYRDLIARADALKKCSPISFPFAIAAFVERDVLPILAATAATAAIRDLKGHESMMTWLKRGLDYHNEHDLTSCLFCSSPIPAGRLDALASLFDDAVNKLIASVAAVRTQASTLDDSLKEFVGSLPHIRDIDPQLHDAYRRTAAALTEASKKGAPVLAAIRSALERKSESPATIVDAKMIPGMADLKAWDADVAARLGEVNELVARHNELCDNFQQSKDDAKLRLKSHHLAAGQAEYSTLEGAVVASQNTTKDLTAKITQFLEEDGKIRQNLRQHGPAAEKINSLIALFLGHKELRIATTNEGYRFERSSGNPLGNLSEGEKTAITLCYFLTLIEAEGRKKSDLIVVVDDPVSSLDTRALNYSVALLTALLKDVGQLFLLTHNLYFMNEIKKWIKPREDSANNVFAPLYYLDVRQRAGDNARCVKITRLPTLLREHESEYQYLFGLILKFAKADDPVPDHIFLMPNAIRRVLETFFAFKVPGSARLPNQLASKVVTKSGFDQQKLRALERLANVESHGDSLATLIALPELTIEETHEAARSMIALVEALDKDHCDQLTTVCMRNPA